MAKNKKNKTNCVQAKLDTIQTIQEFGCLLSEVRENGLFLNEGNVLSLQNYIKKDNIPFEIPTFYKELIDSFSQLKDYKCALDERKKGLSPRWLDQQTVDSLLAFAYSYLEARRITDFADSQDDYFKFSNDFIRAIKPMLVYVHDLETKNLHRKKIPNDPMIKNFQISCLILKQLSQKPEIINDFLEIFEIYDAEHQFNNALVFFRKGWGVLFWEDAINVIAPTDQEQRTHQGIGEKYRLMNEWYLTKAVDLFEMVDNKLSIPINGKTERERDINYTSTIGGISDLLMLADWGFLSHEVLEFLFIPKDDDDLLQWYRETSMETFIGGDINLGLGIRKLMEFRANIKYRYGENLDQVKRMSTDPLNPYDLILKAQLLGLQKDTLSSIVQYRTITETAEQIIQDMPVSVKSKVREMAANTLRFLIPNLYDKSQTYQGLDVVPIFRLGEIIVLTHHSTVVSSFGPGLINLIIGEIGSKRKLHSNMRNTFEQRSLTQLKESLAKDFPGKCGFKFASEFKYVDSDGKDGGDIDLIIYHEGYWLFIEHKWTDIRAEWERIFSYRENQLEKAGDQLKNAREYIFSCADKFKNEISEQWKNDVSLPNPDNSYFLILSTSPEGDYQTYKGFSKISAFELKVLLLQKKFRMMGYLENLDDSAKIDELLRTTCFSNPEKPNIPELMQAIREDWLWKDLIVNSNN